MIRHALTALLAAATCCAGCRHTESRDPAPGHSRSVVLQPFSEFPQASVNGLKDQLALLFDSVAVRPEIALPAAAYYVPRRRYRADSLISFLKQHCPQGVVVPGLTGRYCFCVPAEREKGESV